MCKKSYWELEQGTPSEFAQYNKYNKLMKTNKDYVKKFNEANYLFKEKKSEPVAQTSRPVRSKDLQGYSKSKDSIVDFEITSGSFGKPMCPQIKGNKRHSWLCSKTHSCWQSSLPKSNYERQDVDNRDMFRVTKNLVFDYQGVSKIIEEPEQFRKYLEEYIDPTLYKARAVKPTDPASGSD
jgi:hypothetical protein